MRRLFLLLATVVGSALASPAYAQQTDVIRGKVTGPDSLPLPGVNVKVTSYLGQVTKTTKTDKSGRFNVVFPIGEGDYWVEFTAIGFVPKRFEIKRVADEEILLADAKMASNIATLDQVNVIANPNRALPTRTGSGTDVSGSEKPLTTAGLPPDQAGNLAAMAAQIPGIQLIPGMDGAADMFSALGLGGDQNNTTLNGLGSGLSSLPRDVAVTATIRNLSYDPSIGGFSGGQISLNTRPGTNYSYRNLSGVARAPEAEWTSDIAEDQGQKDTYLSFGGGGRGAFTFDKYFYNVGYSLDRTFKDLQSLLNTSSAGLNAAGVSRDSVDRLLGVLGNLHVPATVAGVPRQQTTDNISLFTNFDLTPKSFGTGNSFNVTLAGNYSRTSNAGASNILTVPGLNSESNRSAGSVSMMHTNYFWFGVLSRSTLGVSTSSTESQPYLRLPAGSVRVNSLLDDGTSSIKNLGFGGNPSADQDARNKTVDFLNTMTWYSGNNRHVLKMSTAFRNEWYDNSFVGNALGSFSFNSLADLEAGRASSFSRTLFSPVRDGSLATASWSLGDSWIPKTGVQIQYGLRVDGNHFGNTPSLNPKIEDEFGIKNTNVPNRVYLSPRLGFQWIYGQAPQIAFVPGAARPPRALVRGGIGVFQNGGSAQLIDAAVTSTGLPSSTQAFSCIGAATPIPDWESYLTNPGAIPTQCADGSAGTVFSNASPSAQLFDREYRLQRSWRTSLEWSGPILANRFAFGASAIYSRNNNQVSPGIDLNLDPTQRFILDNEAGRPVYAPASAIVPNTGAIASSSTRKTTEFSRVSLLKSDLHSSTRQLYLSLRPVINSQLYSWDLSYTIQDVQEQFSGFSSTVTTPFDKFSGRALNEGRHTFQLNAFLNAWDLIRFRFTAALRSGAPFTPMVDGDINGDGARNDRAFVFDPAVTQDPEVADGIQALLDRGSPAARKCLAKQLGQFGARGSCNAPWSMWGSNISVSFNPQKIGLPQRMSIMFSLNNPLLLADLLLNGQDDMRGWGQRIPANSSLLFVRGFDQATQRYKYEVNQRFGSSRPAQTQAFGLTYVSMRIGFDIGAPQERQVLTQRLDVGRTRTGTKYNAAFLKSTASSTIPNPMAMILQQPDSLKLTRKQADSLASLSRAYTLHADSLWTPVAKYLESLPNDYNGGDAYDRYVDARERTVDYLMKVVPSVKKMLTKAQIRMLPQQIQNWMDLRVLRAIRTSSAIGG